MQKYIPVLFILLLFLCLLPVEQATAQTEKTLKESFADLKKSLHPDKTFILPFTDSTNEDLQAFLFAVKDTKGVNTAVLKMEKQKANITVDAKGSLMNVWNNLPKEIRNRYSIGERTPQGFILTDSYQSGSIETNTTTQELNKSTIYKETESSANESYQQKTDTAKKHKSMLEKQQDYAEKMRQRDHDLYKGTKAYENPSDYDMKASKAKGSDYIEYKVNGKPFAMYNNGKSYLSCVTSRADDKQEYTLRDIAHNKQFRIKFTNPAVYPDVRKFEFGKPGFKTTRVGTYGIFENSDLFFLLELRIAGPNVSTDYFASGYIGSAPGKNDNIVSGTFEVLYFEPGMGGIIEVKFNLVIKGGKTRDGKPQPDLIITDGRLRAIMRS